MGERIVADVVQQRGHADCQALLLGRGAQLAQLVEGGQRSPRQVIGAECVLETGVGGAGVDQEGMAELADVAEALNRGRVESKQRRVVDPDVVPERVADDLGCGSRR